MIPARYASTRFPGKPLIHLAGKSMIRHVYERASRVRNAEGVVVATDDRRIAAEVESFGGQAMLTSAEHQSGTDRVGEVAKRIACEWIVNVQGDLPFLDPAMVEAVTDKMVSSGGKLPMGTACTPIRSYSAFVDPNVVKVVVNCQGEALYFSRSPVPYETGGEATMAEKVWGRQHLGLYVYRRDFLLKLCEMCPTALEKAERLEQLRVLEHGHKIQVIEWPDGTVEVNVPGDLELARRYLEPRIS